jgi:hypothetical protein
VGNEKLVAAMQNVPKIVSERLRASGPVADHLIADHPEADVLTAFSERSLSDRERAVVVDHLARCGDCRDALALALPATEATQRVVSPARGWFPWPALRWGFAAAGLVVIASFGVIEYQQRTRGQSTVAKFAEPRAESLYSQPQASPAAVAIPKKERDDSTSMRMESSAHSIAGVPLPSAVKEISEPKRSEPALAAHTAPKGDALQGSAVGAVGGVIHGRQIVGGPNMPVQWQQQQASVTSRRTPQVSTPAARQQSALAAHVPPISQTVTVEATVPATQTETSELQTAQNQAGQSGAVQPQAAPQTSDQSQAASDQTSALVVDEPSDLVSKAKPATTLRAKAMRNAPPHWAISPAGTLQRSFDQGKTWQDVDVAKSSASSQTVALATEKDNLDDKKVSAAPALSVVFRAVAVNGSDVWAGGSNAALYHSLDAGSHWTQVFPTSDGASLTGDVISLEFSDAKQGRIRTATGETWMTADDGQTWQKR